MLFRRKFVLCTVTLTSGCCTLAFLKNSIIGKCESLGQEKKESANIPTYMYLPEIPGEYFAGENFHWFSMFHQQRPIYWQLFMLTKSKNRSVRHKAIKLLCDSTKLEKWEYAMISQACGSLSAVGFARSCKTSGDFFFHPAFRMNKSESLNAEVLNLITSLPFDGPNSYAQDLFERAKRISKRIMSKKNLKNEPEDSFEIYHSERKKRDILEFDKLCLQILLYYSITKPHKFIMIKNGILKILWEILEQPHSETEIQSLIAQILANFSLEEELRNTLHVTGWVGVLASWMNSPHISVCLPSAKALANLDIDDYHHSLYYDDIYLLHPLTRTSDKNLSADIIFVHGLFGGTFWTWRQNDTMKNVNNFYTDMTKADVEQNSKYQNFHSYTFCWPKDWLSSDFPDFRILSIDYNTNIRSWKSLFSRKKESSDFKNKAELLMHKLLKANVGKKPIIWVTHSMGGILVKQLLIEASLCENANSIARNTRGIIFFSVPHKGSDFATFLQSIPFVFQSSKEFSQLNKGSLILLSLHEKFMELVQQNDISILSFGETKKSKWGLDLVSEDSSNPGIGEFYALPVDHLSTCKPESRDSKVYIKITEFLKTLDPVSKKIISNNSVFEMSNIMGLIP